MHPQAVAGRETYPYIHTYFGHKYRPGWPLPEDVCIEDIAWALSHLCRFTGHVHEFYSVAEHSVRASYLVSEENQLDALLHDAAEAYLGDVNRPLKYSRGMEVYKGYEKISHDAISHTFGLKNLGEAAVKNADDRLLVTEQRDLMWGIVSAGNVQKERVDGKTPLPAVIDPMLPEQARNAFLMRYYELTGVREFFKK